jgi:hypothetical protein
VPITLINVTFTAKLIWDCVTGVPESEWVTPVKSQYIYYFSFMRPSSRTFCIDETTPYAADIIDTWNRTIKTAGIFRGSFTVDLPARQYMAVRLRRVEE